MSTRRWLSKLVVATVGMLPCLLVECGIEFCGRFREFARDTLREWWRLTRVYSWAYADLWMRGALRRRHDEERRARFYRTLPPRRSDA